MVALIIKLIVGTTLLSTQPTTRWYQMPPVEIEAFLRDLKEQEPDIAQRLIIVTERFLETRYGASPLGEGPGNPPDEDPLWRLDVVDCVTFVEESMALARSENLAEAREMLQRIRYQGATIDYRHRKHFMMAQWIPDNQREGFLQDITASIGGAATIRITKRLDPKIWSQRINENRWPALTADAVPRGESVLSIIPMRNMRRFLPNVPPASVVLIVRQDLPTIPERISHLGLVVMHHGRRYVRHAASGTINKVIDEPFDAMIRRHGTYRRWPVTGYNFQRILAAAEPPRGHSSTDSQMGIGGKTMERIDQ